MVAMGVGRLSATFWGIKLFVVENGYVEILLG